MEVVNFFTGCISYRKHAIRNCMDLLRAFLAFVLFAGTTAFSQDLSHRFYVGGDLGVAWRDLNGPLLIQPDAYRGLPPSRVSFRRHSDEGEGYLHGRLGVILTKFLSVEVGYQDFGYTYVDIEPPANIVFIVPPPTNYRFRDYAFTFDPVFRWPINDRVRVYAFWGLAMNHSKVDVDYRGSIFSGVYQTASTKGSHSNQSRIGAGADIRLVKRLDLHVGLDYQRFASYTKEGWFAHAGVNYAF